MVFALTRFRCKCAMPCNYRKNGKNAAIFHADTLMFNTNTITIPRPARWFARHAEPPSGSRMWKKQGGLKKCHVKDCPTKIDQFCMSRGSDLIRPLIISSGNITAVYTCFWLSPIDRSSRKFFQLSGTNRAELVFRLGHRSPHLRNRIFVPPCPGTILGCRNFYGDIAGVRSGLDYRRSRSGHCRFRLTAW